MWSALQKVSRPISKHSCSPLVHEDVSYHDAEDQARIFADHFFPSSGHQDTAFHCQIESEVAELLDHRHTSPIHSITSQEIHEAIHSSGPWKAPGLDNVTNICLRRCEDVLMPLLIQLFTASLRLGYVPPYWKTAIVVAVPKPGKDPLSPQGYRPISLLSAMGKLLERIIANRLTFSLQSRGLLAPSQFGF